MARVTEADQDLQKAAKAGNLHGVKDALARGGDPDAVNFFDRTALNYAISAKSAECVRAMIEAGAEVNMYAGGMHCRPPSHARTVGTPEIIAILQAAGACDPTPRVPKQLSAAEIESLVKRSDQMIMATGFEGLIREQGTEIVYDFHDCLKAIGAKRKEAAVLHFIRTLHGDLGPCPSQKRALAFMGRHLQHFQAIDEKYRQVQDDLEAACRASYSQTLSAAEGRATKDEIDSEKDTPRNEELCEIADDGETQVLWDGFSGLVLNRGVDFLNDFRDALKALGATNKASLVTAVIELLEDADGQLPSEEKADEKLEASSDFVTSLDSKYYDIKDEDLELLKEKYLRDPT